MKKNCNIKIAVGIVGVLLVAGTLVFLCSGDNLLLFREFFRAGITREEIRAIAQKFGVRGVISVGLLSMLQVILMFLPAEPVQVIAGASYGLGFGLLLCTAGVFFGNTIVYLGYKFFGTRLGEYYTRKIDIDLGSAKTVRGVSLLVLLLYILPAIPYGMICFFAASTGMRYPRYILLTVLGAVPSVLIGVGLGHLAITASLIWAAVVFALLVVILIVLFVKRDAWTKRLNAWIRKRNTPYTSDTVVQPQNKALFHLAPLVLGLPLSCLLRIRYENRVGKPTRPSIILVPHGSFIDFAYTLKYLWRECPHIVSARMYLYQKTLGSLLKRSGVIPKSMFTADFESARNCLRVLKTGEILLLMPEARLSTVGRYEGIQEATVKFLQKSGVDLYLFRIQGNYFAKPKWGKGLRRGSRVECSFSKLYSAEELQKTEFDVFCRRLDEAMTYDEYEWLEAHPKLRYRQKRLAEGLEGVLYRCPACGAEGVGETRGRVLRCTACGLEARLDDRYAFVDKKPFADLRDWYDAQLEVLRAEVAADEHYVLESRVRLKHASIDGKTCLRPAGEGVCRLDRSGLTYEGTDDGAAVSMHFNGNQVYRLLFGVNEDFELYVGKVIWYFVPENVRLCAKWYLCSIALSRYFKGADSHAAKEA